MPPRLAGLLPLLVTLAALAAQPALSAIHAFGHASPSSGAEPHAIARDGAVGTAPGALCPTCLAGARARTLLSAGHAAHGVSADSTRHRLCAHRVRAPRPSLARGAAAPRAPPAG